MGQTDGRTISLNVPYTLGGGMRNNIYFPNYCQWYGSVAVVSNFKCNCALHSFGLELTTLYSVNFMLNWGKF